MKKFRTLELAIQFYQLGQSLCLPKHLRDQFDRASSSISLNLAEGNAKFSFKDKARIYQIAYGSLRESQTVLDLAGIKNGDIHEISKYLGSSLYRLIEATMKMNSQDFKNGKAANEEITEG